MNRSNVRLDAIGQIYRLPEFVQEQLAKTKAALAKNNGLTLILALSYGGRTEIVEAARSLATKVKAGQWNRRKSPSNSSPSTSTRARPDPDLLIRTSGEMRVSNFLLWQISYAELVVTPTLWPDFRKPQFFEALEEYTGDTGVSAGFDLRRAQYENAMPCPPHACVARLGGRSRRERGRTLDRRTGRRLVPPRAGSLAATSPQHCHQPLEMWQADTSIPPLTASWAGPRGLAPISVRVFLHHLPWQQDAPGFIHRLDQCPGESPPHWRMFVLLDACWDPFPQPGKQRAPRPFIHNSAGCNARPRHSRRPRPTRMNWKPYVTGVIGHFRNDRRIHFWDLFNEPGQHQSPGLCREGTGEEGFSLLLLREVFAGARGGRATGHRRRLAGRDWEPAKASPFNRFILEQSGTCHVADFGPRGLPQLGRPRSYGRPPEHVRPAWREQSALNWARADHLPVGSVEGDEPPVWFHDILGPTARRQREGSRLHPTRHRPDENRGLAEKTPVLEAG